MRFSVTVFFMLLIVVGCKQQPQYSEKIDISESWSYDEPLVYSMDITDLSLYYDLILSLDYSIDFGFQNVYVKIETEYPDAKKVEDILSLNITNGSGTFLGDCGSNSCTINLLLQENFKFQQKGKHIFSIYQNGREDHLKGINSAALKLYTVE